MQLQKKGTKRAVSPKIHPTQDGKQIPLSYTSFLFSPPPPFLYKIFIYRIGPEQFADM